MSDDQAPEQEDPPGVTAAIRLPQLTPPVPAGIPAPSFEELGLRELVEVCRAWQLHRAGSTFWELNAGARTDVWREIPVLMGSTAESALLAGSAQVEIERLRRAIEAGELPNEYGLAQRFFAEAQGQQILGCGHRMANIAVRAMMLVAGYPWGTAVGLNRPVTPFSDHQGDWIAMSRLSEYRRAAAASPFPSLVRLATVVVDLEGSSQWQRLEDQRGTDFHRGRHESPFVAGARRESVWRFDAQTRILEPGGEDVPTDAEGERWLADLGADSLAALLLLPRSMRRFEKALADAMKEITGGSFDMGER
jgi:hypothetical protein